MQTELNKIAKDTNLFLKKFIKKQKKSKLIIPMQYGLFSGGKKIFNLKKKTNEQSSNSPLL